MHCEKLSRPQFECLCIANKCRLAAMFPIRDDIQPRSTPLINYSLIAFTAFVFVLQLNHSDALIGEFGMIPARLSGTDVTPAEINGDTLPEGVLAPWTTLVSCIFLHGSVMHLAGNLWFLWIFGDNVEDRIGRFGFFAFYVCAGAAASLTHFTFQPDSPIPTIGASGAVAGIMGAYMVLYPNARVTALVPLFFILQIMTVRAPLFLGVWFIFQLLQGTFSMNSTEAAGVAWWAHAGGFVFGCAVAMILRRKEHELQPRVRVIRIDG